LFCCYCAVRAVAVTWKGRPSSSLRKDRHFTSFCGFIIFIFWVFSGRVGRNFGSSLGTPFFRGLETLVCCLATIDCGHFFQLFLCVCVWQTGAFLDKFFPVKNTIEKRRFRGSFYRRVFMDSTVFLRFVGRNGIALHASAVLAVSVKFTRD